MFQLSPGGSGQVGASRKSPLTLFQSKEIERLPGGRYEADYGWQSYTCSVPSKPTSAPERWELIVAATRWSFRQFPYSSVLGVSTAQCFPHLTLVGDNTGRERAGDGQRSRACLLL